MSRFARHSITTACLTLGAFAVFWVGSRFYLQHQVLSLVEDLRKLDSSSDPTKLSSLLMKKYAKHFNHKFCQADYCATRFRFTNAVLSTFHLAPSSEIMITFEQLGSSLRDVSVDYTSSVFKENSPIVYVTEIFCSVNCGYFALNPHGRNVSQTWNGDVSYGLGVRPEIRRAGWGLNPACFTAIRGCRNVSELLPAFWKVITPGTVSSRVRSDSDSIAESSLPLAD